MDSKKDKGIQAIGRFINNFTQEKHDRSLFNQDEIIGKSSNERSNIKDYNTGEVTIKSALIFPAFALWTSKLYQFNDLSATTENIKILKEKYPNFGLEDLNNLSSKVTENIGLINDKIMDISITEAEFAQSENGILIAEKMSELSGLNITPTNLTDLMIVLSVVGAAGMAVYIRDKSVRLSYEEKIASYSDDLRHSSETMKSLRNQRIAFDIALAVSAPLKNNGYLATCSKSLLSGLDFILTMPKKVLRKISELVLQDESEKNMFTKTLTSLVESFGGQKEWLSIYLKDENKKLNGQGYLSNAIKLIDEVKEQAKDKQSITSSDDYSYSSNISIIKADAQQQKLKNNILMSLNKAANLYLTKSPESKESKEAKKVLEKIKNLHNNKAEQKFDNYEAISHLSKSVLNGDLNLNLENVENIEDEINKELTSKLDKYSLDLSYKHFEDSVEDFKEIYLSNNLSSNQINNFDKSMKKILKKYKDEIYTEDGFQEKNLGKACKEIQMFFHQHKKYLNGCSEIDAAYNLKNKIQVFFQDYQNRNIKPYEGSYLEFIEERLRVNKDFINSKDLSNDNTYAVNNHLQPNKIKI